MSAQPFPAARRGAGALAALAALTLPAAAQSHVIGDAEGEVVLTVREDAALGFVVESLGDDLDPLAIQFGATDLWQLEFHRGPQCILIGPSDLDGYVPDLVVLDDKVTFEWDDATSPLLPGEEFTVEVEFEVDHGVDEIEANVHVFTETPLSALHRVRFPRLDVVPPGPAASTRLAAPIQHGVLLPDPVHNVTLAGPAKINDFLPPCDAFTLVEPGNLSMQWWSLYDELDPAGTQLYFGTQDHAGFRKEWLVEPATDGGVDRLRLMLRHVPEDNHLPNNDYLPQYPFVMRVLRGDWYDGAQYYRDWALHQPWTAQGPMRDNPDFSAISRAAKALGVTQVPGGGADPDTFCPQDPDWSAFAYWAAETASTRQTLDIDAVTPRIFFWDFNSFDRDVGAWFPVRPEFIAGAQAVRALGADFSVYFGSLRYSTRIPSYQSSYVPDPVGGGTYGPVEPWGLVDANGQRRFGSSIVCPSQPTVIPSLLLCQATSFTADYAAYVARRTYAEAGARGFYIDVVSGTDVELCYDPAHGHPLGGGSYYTEGIQNVFQTVREEMRDHPTDPVPEHFLQSEGAGEHYLPWVDATQAALTWNRTQTFCDVFTGQCPVNGTDFIVIPSYNTVYNEFQLTGATLQLNAPRVALGPIGVPILLDPFFMRTLRNLATAHVALGYEPFAGSILSQHVMGDNANPALFPDYFLLVDTVRRYFDVLELDAVRRFTVEGRRLRDPAVTQAASDLPLPAFPFDGAPFRHNWLAGGRFQPVVYGSLHSSAAGSTSAQALDEVGLLLLNWTDPADAPFFGAANVGDRIVRATFDVGEVAPDARSYRAYLVDATGETLLEEGAIDGPIVLEALAPARSAVFVRFALSADELPAE